MLSVSWPVEDVPTARPAFGVNAALRQAQDKLLGVKHALRSKIVSKEIPETERLASKVRYTGFLATLRMTLETFVYPK